MNTNLSMYCLSLKPSHLNIIQKLNYLPVALGSANFSKEWIRDNKDINISDKNPFYGEYTFHYWLWKNYLDSISEDKWIGFCQYRKFWTQREINSSEKFSEFENLILKNIPEEYNRYEAIIGNPVYVNKFRFKKFIKRNLRKMLLTPSLLFKKEKRTIKFHFDMWHGEGNLDKAINELDQSEKKDFLKFVETGVSFNPHNMFICKSKKTLNEYYSSVFPWLKRCEKIFGFDNLDGYGLKRIYGFLAERYMSYWFRKYTKFKELPIYFKDVTDFDE